MTAHWLGFKKETLYKVLRIVISISLIVFLLSRANLPELVAVLKSANVWWFLVALLVEFIRVLISSYRWQILLSAKKIHNSLGSLISFYMVGYFFNMLLPTVWGGDVVRTYELAKYSERAADSIASVLVERTLDLVGLFVICWVSLAVFGLKRFEGTNILPIISGLSMTVLFLVVLLFNRRLMEKLISLGRIIKWWDTEAKLRGTYDSLLELALYRRSLGTAFGVSLIYQFVGIISAFLISQALGLGVPFSFFLVVMPIIWVIMMIPISIAGLGVRESAFVFFFAQHGVPTESALLLSLLFFSLTLVLALVGGSIYGLGKHRRQTI